MKRHRQPIALTIAGSDSGGGAGIQADLKTFAAFDVHGTTAITCVTAQNPKGVRSIQAVIPAVVVQQIEAVFDELPPAAVKTGMLYSTEIIRAVAGFFAQGKRPPLVVDPVMVATSGARLLDPEALKAMQDELLPLATVVTPNLVEAEALTGRKITSLEDMLHAAVEIQKRFGCAVLLKGGHLRVGNDAVDLLADHEGTRMFGAPFVRGVATHGTGCHFSAAITAHLAHGFSLREAVEDAKKFITGAISQSTLASKQTVLNPFWAE